MNMLMWGDGNRVVRGNALALTDFNGRSYEPAEYHPNKPDSGCTLILANPPFGSKERDKTILQRYELGTKFRAARAQPATRDNSTVNEGGSQKSEILFLEKGIKLLRPEGRMLIVIPQGILSGRSYGYVRDFIRREAEIRAIVSLPTHTFVQSGVPTVNTCVLYVQKFTEEKRRLYQTRTKGLPESEISALLRKDPDFDYQIFMAASEFVGYEPSGRMILEPGERTDLDFILEDFAHQSVITGPETDLFNFAAQHYGEKTTIRRDQTVRGTVRGLKTSFVVPFAQTEDRLDPPYYFFRHQTQAMRSILDPLGDSIEKAGPKWRPATEDELDAEYPILSVSSDGKLTLNEYRKGEEITQAYRKVERDDIVYNPMRINIGSVAVVPQELAGGLVSPDYVVFRSNYLDPWFLVSLLRSPFYKMYIDVVATGSIRDRLLFEELRTIRVPAVSDKEQARIIARQSRADEEIVKLLQGIAQARSANVERLHELIEKLSRPRE